MQCNLSLTPPQHHLQEVILNSLSSSQYTSDSSELVKVVLGTAGEVRLQYLSKQTSLQQIVCHWQQLTYHFIEILPKGEEKKIGQLSGRTLYHEKSVRNGYLSVCKVQEHTRWKMALDGKQKAIKR